MIRIITLVFIFISFVFWSSFVCAKDTSPMLVLDMRNAPQLPKNFRSVNDHLPEGINKTGLGELHMAGGAQFSRASLNSILQHLHTRNIMVVDLREEPHGMLNSNAVSWYGLQNADNAGKDAAQIEEEQAALLKSLGEEKVAVVNTVLQKSPEGEIKKVKPIEYLVHQTNTEENLLNEMNLHYRRLYVQDFHAPTNKQVDRFIELIHSMPKSGWIYFHCRAGVGRTTVFMTMYDIMRNAKQVSFEDILARQTALGGKDLSSLPNEDHFKYDWAVERKNFISKFYEYARNNKDNFHTSWSEWVEKKKS